MTKDGVYESIMRGLNEAVEDSVAEKPFLKRNVVSDEQQESDKTEE